MEHHRDQVGGRVLAHFPVPQRLEIGAALVHVLEALRPQLGRLDHFDVPRPIRPEGELATILPRKVEQDRQHLRGEFDRNAVDPVEARVPIEPVEYLGGAGANVVRHPRHFGRCEGRGDSAALAGMFRPIHRDKHRHTHVAAVLDEIGDGDPAGPARIQIGQRFDMDDRLVGRDRPIGPEVRIRDVVDRRRRAQVAERGMPQVVAIEFCAADVERIDPLRACYRSHPHSPILA